MLKRVNWDVLIPWLGVAIFVALFWKKVFQLLRIWL